MNKKIIFSIILTGLILTLTVGAVFAWFNFSIKNESNFSISEFDIEVLVSNDIDNFEEQLMPNEPLFDFDGKSNLEPGDTQTKYLKIINHGDIPIAYELKFNGVGDVLSQYMFIDINKSENTTNLICNELSSVSFGDGEKLQIGDYVIYSLTLTFNANLEQFETLIGETFKLETYISAWQYNYDESKPTATTVETIEVLDQNYIGWVDGTDNILFNYDTKNMANIKIEPKGVGLTEDSELFVEYIKINGEMIDISYVSGVDSEGYSFNTDPLIKGVATFNNYRYYYSNILCIKIIGEGESQGLEYITIDLSDVDNLEVYLRCVDSKERIEFLVTKTVIN